MRLEALTEENLPGNGGDGVIDDETFERFRREMVGMVRRMARERRRPPSMFRGVTPLEMETLIAVLDAQAESGAARPSAVAALLGTSPSTLSQTIGGLVKKELVDRHRASEDLRGVELALTKKGASLARRVSTQRDERARALFEFLGEEDSRAFMRIAGRIAEFHEKRHADRLACAKEADHAFEGAEPEGEGGRPCA